MLGRSLVFSTLPQRMLHCAVVNPAQHSDTLDLYIYIYMKSTWTCHQIQVSGLVLIEVQSDTFHNTGHVSGCKGTRRYDKGTVQVTQRHFPTRETREGHKAIKRAEFPRNLRSTAKFFSRSCEGLDSLECQDCHREGTGRLEGSVFPAMNLPKRTAQVQKATTLAWVGIRRSEL